MSAIATTCSMRSHPPSLALPSSVQLTACRRRSRLPFTIGSGGMKRSSCKLSFVTPSEPAPIVRSTACCPVDSGSPTAIAFRSHSEDWDNRRSPLLVRASAHGQLSARSATLWRPGDPRKKSQPTQLSRCEKASGRYSRSLDNGAVRSRTAASQPLRSNRNY